MGEPKTSGYVYIKAPVSLAWGTKKRRQDQSQNIRKSVKLLHVEIAAKTRLKQENYQQTC